MKTKHLLVRSLCILLASMALVSCGHIGKPKTSKGVIHQVGLVWLKEAGDEETRKKVVEAVHDFGRHIPEVESAAVGMTDGEAGPYSDASYDLCFILTFADEAARQRYNEHPVHQKAAKEIFLPHSRKLLFYRFVGQ